MRLRLPGSRNVEDRRGRGMGGRGGVAVGGIGGVVLLVLALLFGVDPAVLLGGPDSPAPQVERAAPAQEDPGRRLVGQVLRETELVWNAQFEAMGRRYEEPVLVLFSEATRSGCGLAQAQAGPFYCPADRRVYIDLDFLAALQRRLGAPGEFAAAYVVAHEVGHHVQNLLGVLPRVQAARERLSPAESNALLVRLELQADCLAGLWANHAQRARGILEPGDVEQGLNAAAAVGDDRLRADAGQRVRPESFTHGTSAQRVGWFRRGLETGSLAACDTFSGPV